MKRFKNILYVLDEKSVNLLCDNNAKRVAELANLNDAKITVALANGPRVMDDIGLMVTGRYDEVKEILAQEQQEQLTVFTSQACWQGLDVTSHFDRSADFISLIQKVIRDGHDLVITEGNLDHGIDLLAMRLVRKCPCPVWVIKRNAGNFTKVLAAVDLRTNTLEAEALNKKIVELTHSLAQREQGEAHYLNAWRLEHEAMLRGPRFTTSEDEISAMKEKLRSQRQRGLLEVLAHARIKTDEERIHLRQGQSNEVICQMIDEMGIDVVVMGSVGRSGIPGLLIGNKAESLLGKINCTVLTVKPDGFISPVTIA